MNDMINILCGMLYKHEFHTAMLFCTNLQMRVKFTTPIIYELPGVIFDIYFAKDDMVCFPIHFKNGTQKKENKPWNKLV